jgi:hypothetical protein
MTNSRAEIDEAHCVRADLSLDDFVLGRFLNVRESPV